MIAPGKVSKFIGGEHSNGHRPNGVHWHVFYLNFSPGVIMGLLRDEDLVTNLQLANPVDQYVWGITLPTDPYSRESPVQASSMELHIGDILLPEAKEGPDGTAQVKNDHVLKTGETAVVMTHELLRLPSDVAAFGFPPTRVSSRGLLMTNPGHVDPGYKGRMRFTVINMSKDPFSLNRGDAIVKLLFFQLDHPVRRDWRKRNPGGYPPPKQIEVNRLSKDFVDVENRADSIATKRGIQWSAGISVAVALLAVLIQLISSGQLFGANRKLEDLKNQIDVSKRFSEYDKKIAELEMKIQSLQKGR